MSSANQPVASYSLPADVAATLKKIGVAVPLWDRAVTPEEIQYFLDRWPYLQILSSNIIDPFEQVEQVTAKSNWIILNYGDAMASSPGKFLFGGGDYRIGVKRKKKEDDDDGDGGALVNPDKGTIWRQSFETAAEMAALAKKLGWEGIHIVDGHPNMKWAIWMHAMDAEMSLTGFEPSERDVERRERVKRSEIEDIKRFHYRM